MKAAYMKMGTNVSNVQFLGVQVPYEEGGYVGGLTRRVGACTMLVRIDDATGRSGWGEIPLSYHPVISGEAIEALAMPMVRALVLGKPPSPRQFITNAEQLSGWPWYPYMCATIAGGIELGLWDLLAKQLGVHVTELLGGRVRDGMECVDFIFETTPDGIASEICRGAESGYRVFYLKWRGSEDDMVQKMTAATNALPKGAILRTDPNEAWDRISAARRLEALREFRIEFVEQPLPRIDQDGAATLRNRSPVALGSDQGTRVIRDVLAGLSKRAMDTLSVAPSDAGGVCRSLDIARVASVHGLPVSMHSNNETAVGYAALVSIACVAENCTYASQAVYQHHEWDIADGLEYSGPFLSVDWDRPGWGIKIDEERLSKARQNFSDGGFGAVPPDEL